MKNIDKLNFSDSGIFLIVTHSQSEYTLDLTEKRKTLRRKRKRDNAQSVALRKDGEPIEIIGLFVQVGKPAVFLLEPLGIGISTTRITTVVQKIVMISNLYIN